MQSPADEIKSRLDIIEAIRQYVPLKPAGINFVARCPFHNEKTASFNVSPTKQVWHCFGCGKGGDLFSFIMEIEKISFVEALRLLAPRAGVVLKQESGPEASFRNRVLDVLDQAMLFYHDIFMKKQAGEPARAYASGRGISAELVNEWKIGYAPDSWDDLILHLRKIGFSEKEIIGAGLAIKREQASGIYNRFRGRLMFPIREVNGNVIGFTGRILPEFEKREHNQGKYVNSPQTIVYDKSRVLFGLDKAKQAIREADCAVVVEGQMDCLTAHQFGFTNVVASSGTALTEEQARLIKRFANRVAFAFDMDAPGRQALERGTEQAFAQELEALAVSLPQGKDPDECIRRDANDFKQSLAEAKPVMEYYLDEAVQTYDPDTASGRRSIVKHILPRIVRIANPIEKDFWIKKLSQAVDVNEAFLREAIQSPKETNTVADTAMPERTQATREELLSEQLVALLLAFPENIAVVSPYIPAEQIIGAANQLLYRQLVVYYNKIVVHAENDFVFSYMAFRSWLLEQGLLAGDIHTLDRLAILVEKQFSEISAEEANSAIKEIQNELRRSYLSRRLKAVAKLIGELESQAQGEGRDERLEILLKEFNDLAEEVRQVSAPLSE